MSAAISLPQPTPDLTLLDLVAAVCDVAEDEAEAVAIVQELLRSGSVRLAGNFRECHIAPLERACMR